MELERLNKRLSRYRDYLQSLLCEVDSKDYELVAVALDLILEVDRYLSECEGGME